MLDALGRVLDVHSVGCLRGSYPQKKISASYPMIFDLLVCFADSLWLFASQNRLVGVRVGGLWAFDFGVSCIQKNLLFLSLRL